MADHPHFGVLLARLLNSRQADVAWLASASGIPESEVRLITDGTPPSLSRMDGLAAALGWHTADLLVIARLPIPRHLQPCEPATGRDLCRLLRVAMAVSADQRTHIHQSVEQSPQLRHVPLADPPRTYYRGDGGFGEMLVTMLCINRNLRSPSSAVKALAMLTTGGMYLAASTINSLGAGRAQMKPTWVAGFATILGVPATDLAAITGIDLPEPARPDDPLAAEMANLLWACRRLTANQIENLRAEAEAMLVAVPSNASDDDWNRIYRSHDGTWWGTPKQ